MKVKFCPPSESSLAPFAGVIGEVKPESITAERLTFTFEVNATRGPHMAMISTEWGHVELVSE